MDDLYRAFTISTRDPCGDLQSQTQVKRKLRKQHIFNKEFQPSFHTKRM
jgi:hypothetical protein